MSFSFFKVSRPKTPQEVVKAMKDSLVALDTKTVVEVKALEKALEEVEKNFVSLRCMLCGDGEVEPNTDQVSQLALEVCKEDVLALMIHKLPNLEWEARKDLVLCWSILLKQMVDSRYCSVQYIENHFELLDFLVVWSLVYCDYLFIVWASNLFVAFLSAALLMNLMLKKETGYDNKEIALNCGLILRECIKFPTLAKYILESASFELFFKFVELPNFDVASDAFSTFKDLLTKHGTVVAEYLTAHYDEFFDQYEKLLTSSNYVTRRQSLKLLSEFLLEPPSSHIMKRYIQEVRYLKVMMTLLKSEETICFYLAMLLYQPKSNLASKNPLNGRKALKHMIYSPITRGNKRPLQYQGFDVLTTDSSKNIQISAFHIFKVFVANPNKPREVKVILAKNHEKLLELLHNLSAGKGAEDEQFEEEKELIIKEIDRLSRLSNLDR
ncbi:hypothetical protein DKX38_014950 [Salix brachista]|uniref:Uncharacterized protein n=1 Tax=Salix brachista TaxID=2182728 RepID=A0A5N5L3U7_9ROSI|nr:hypothetical protein DKX38_014950 [Salix brachista]